MTKEIKFDLNEVAFQEISRLKRLNQIIPFPEVFRVLGITFHLNKEKSMNLLRRFEKEGRLKVIPFRGVRIRRT